MGEPGILVTGASGQLGTALAAVLPDAMFIDRGELDLAHPERIGPYVTATAPSAVINAAAFTAVDLAESEAAVAMTVNGSAVGELARVTAELGVPLITFSTDYVFDGTATEPYVESAPTRPIGAYGRSKLVGEWLAAANHPAALVIRTSWLVSTTHENFITAILRRARRGIVKVVDDQVGTPTIAADLATAVVQALDDGVTGVAHLANVGVASRFEFAVAAVEAVGMDPAVVVPCSSDEFPTAATRPAYSALGSERSDLPVLPAWRSSIEGVAVAQIARLDG